MEKSANDEANKAIDRLTRQIRELEQSYEEERKNNKDVNNKLDKVEKEYSSVKRQLTSEVENKKNVIGNLSKELEVHQKNFNELKEELSKVHTDLWCNGKGIKINEMRLKLWWRTCIGFIYVEIWCSKIFIIKDDSMLKVSDLQPDIKACRLVSDITFKKVVYKSWHLYLLLTLET